MRALVARCISYCFLEWTDSYVLEVGIVRDALVVHILDELELGFGHLDFLGRRGLRARAAAEEEGHGCGRSRISDLLVTKSDLA